MGHGIPQYTGELPLGLDGFNGAVPLGHGIRRRVFLDLFGRIASMGPCLWGTEYQLTIKWE